MSYVVWGNGQYENFPLHPARAYLFSTLPLGEGMLKTAEVVMRGTNP